MNEKEKDELVEMRHVPGTCGATLRITRQGIILSILCEFFPNHDFEDLAPLAKRLYEEVVQPLEAKP
jgi:hypothetical protein